MLHPWKWKWEKVPDLTSSGDRKNAWKGLTLWKSPKICEDPFLNPQWSLIKGQGFAETPRQWLSPALRPKESLRGDSNGDEKPGCYMPFNETLSLPLKVGGDRVLYIKNLWEVPRAQALGQALGSPVPLNCLIVSNRLSVTGPKRDHLTLLSYGRFFDLRELSWNRKTKWELPSAHEHLDSTFNDS